MATEPLHLYYSGAAMKLFARLIARKWGIRWHPVEPSISFSQGTLSDTMFLTLVRLLLIGLGQEENQVQRKLVKRRWHRLRGNPAAGVGNVAIFQPPRN